MHNSNFHSGSYLNIWLIPKELIPNLYQNMELTDHTQIWFYLNVDSLIIMLGQLGMVSKLHSLYRNLSITGLNTLCILGSFYFHGQRMQKVPEVSLDLSPRSFFQFLLSGSMSLWFGKFVQLLLMELIFRSNVIFSLQISFLMNSIWPLSFVLLFIIVNKVCFFF